MVTTASALLVAASQGVPATRTEKLRVGGATAHGALAGDRAPSS